MRLIMLRCGICESWHHANKHCHVCGSFHVPKIVSKTGFCNRAGTEVVRGIAHSLDYRNTVHYVVEQVNKRISGHLA